MNPVLRTGPVYCPPPEFCTSKSAVRHVRTHKSTPYTSVMLLPEARVGGHEYSSLLVCFLSVTHELAAIAFTTWIAFTQVISGRFLC